MGRYVVTGGCGFIGSHLVCRLQDLGHEVCVLDNLSTGKIENLRLGTSLIIAEVTDSAAVEEAMQGADGCFHLSAIPSVAASREDWIGTHRTNLTGTITVFEAARWANPGRVVRVIYASSAAVYGDNPNLPAAESDRARPLTAYAADKLACELHGRVAWLVHGIPAIGFRFFNVYGERQDSKSPYSGVISTFIDLVSRDMPIKIFGDGGQIRDFVYVDNIIDFLICGITVAPAHRIYNVCTGRPTTVRALADIIGSLFGLKPRIVFCPKRPGDISASLGDPSKARDELGLEAKTCLREGLKKMIDALPMCTARPEHVGASERPNTNALTAHRQLY